MDTPRRTLVARRCAGVIVLTAIVLISVTCGYLIKRSQIKAEHRLEAPGQGFWCIAKPGAPVSILTENVDFACNVVDCSSIREGGECYYPQLPYSSASYAMNLYYQMQGKRNGTCDFKNTGTITVVDPSYGSCIYEQNP